MPEVNADTNVGELIEKHPAVLAVFERHGMNCQQCMALADETLGGAATMHSLDLDRLIEEIRTVLSAELTR